VRDAVGEFRMPSLGADMEEGTVLEWLVHPGDHVNKGDIVAVVKTDKADVEIEVFESGTVGELLVAVGTTVEVGTPIATIVDGDAAAPSAPAPSVEPEPSVAPEPTVTPTPTVRDATRARVTPYARRMAAELGVDLGAVAAPAGAPATAKDIRAAAPATPAEPRDQASAMRHAIANLMARSKREIPHYYLHQQVDMSVPLAWLDERNASEPAERRILPAAMLYKASAIAARTYPEMNGFWVDDAFQPASGVHLGVAISLRGGGLIAPAVHDADTLSLVDLMEALRDLSARTRAGRLRSSEMNDPTITVTNLGDQGVDTVFGVIYPPQVALVGFGKPTPRPWAVGTSVEVRPVVDVTLAADHRATDGHVGARFLATIERHLLHPEDL
jgi:pyruvate dehydrogenase E2 component (dihydrolipoyllysine-residue acetyltransferase)